ncbi:D-alanyl-lipoteichoic acid acyltransferase DltB, MBOAT superfamily [Tistlia consotensis]|uniref:Probable alginate O-acetylase AlgI n=1 Tax=Tistlia consotensis USBA 355 TaxID=560819 RepID=A0A1Y6BEL9_9PROT|nr:MBOAT family O-acyltransferase [Tistlia consotensis]SMF07398.1 D-alanyl-lipoteichoic acid acyltransferase DltB, MBOAT superfamily [Tistlia consotensis USBA 355]SNR35908.1 D-alanyl-lipoteichoic acid acyltransferase DltB, MBOAT superfamily [Tistlia consotensis]
MNFASLEFGVFFLVVLVIRLFYRQSGSRVFVSILVLLSLVFYGWEEPSYVFLILLSTVIDFFAALAIEKYRSSPRTRRAIVTISCVANLGLLGFFKYTGFFVQNLSTVLPLEPGIATALRGIVLPIGISFYTFQSMSYTIDVYRGEKPTRSFLDFIFYISFFPQLVAGPIVRAHNFLYQIHRVRSIRLVVWLEGFRLMILGFFLKLVVADNIGYALSGINLQSVGIWDYAVQPDGPSTLAWYAIILFPAQIFCDFAGYTNIARGLAYLLGFRLPINFNAPYLAGSFSEFWHRWHITLSTWLRDYLYIPLGGNRISKGRTLVNVMAVMLLGGLWHGAGWTFIVWGAIHGTGLVVERAAGIARVTERWLAARLGWFLVVQAVVLFAWIFFRSSRFAEAGVLITNAARLDFPHIEIADYPNLQAALIVIWAVPLLHLRALLREAGGRPFRETRIEQAIVSGFLLIATLSFYGEGGEFIYFQF